MIGISPLSFNAPILPQFFPTPPTNSPLPYAFPAPLFTPTPPFTPTPLFTPSSPNHPQSLMHLTKPLALTAPRFYDFNYLQKTVESQYHLKPIAQAN
ncbi:hypothetical protein MNL09_07405 [Bartonella krasnovii]|nr:hypothetical protein MNL09_07405 [Bartonella krasnovii]